MRSFNTLPNTFSFEETLFFLSSSLPESIKARLSNIESYYKNGDPCIMFYLKNGNSFYLRIRKSHMESSNECQNLTRQGKIFLSSSKYVNSEKSHLPIFGWYSPQEDKVHIWNEILRES